MTMTKSLSLSEIVTIIGAVIIITFIFYIMVYFTITSYEEYKEYQTYKTFCEEKPSFCYCSQFSCEYKTQWNSATGLSNDTVELCKLANKLNDKETLFKAGC